MAKEFEGSKKREERLGQLNPDWVCWLQGWPIGADSLEPMPDLLWLDWEIDPADMEESEVWRTPMECDYKNMLYANQEYLSNQVRKIVSTGPIPRVATGIKDRVNRLKALGNGIVPQCMVVAWNILTGDYFID